MVLILLAVSALLSAGGVWYGPNTQERSAR